MKSNSWETLFSWLKQGLGQGHFEAYQAFLRITRSRFPRKANQLVGVLPGYQRRFDFWSRNEHRIALLCAWLGVRDIREQYPLWPWAHAHPLYDWPLFPLEPGQAPALLDVAREAGIDHGTYVGTKIPYVATTDLLVTLGANEAPRLLAISCKPRALLTPIPKHRRILERLELERRYWIAVGGRHLIADGAAVNSTLFANLEAIAPDVTMRERVRMYSDFETIQQHLSRRLEGEAIRDAVWATARDLQCDLTCAWDAFHILAWRQDIDIDLGRPMLHSEPVALGGARRKDMLKRAWLEGADHA